VTLGDAAEAGSAAHGPSGVPSGGGTLYVVATPIGNLGDVTLRALEILRAVPLVACEDTRITRRLLARYEVAVRLTSFHARSPATRLAALLDHLGGGADLALTTDAGTPGVSDPGEALVRAWAATGGLVVPIPGASAVLAAVAAAGVAGARWTFEGFLPRAGRERKERLARLADDDRGAVIYEAPSRLLATLRDLAAACDPERPAAVCRELTKVHEQIQRGSMPALVEAVQAGRLPARGELVIVVGEFAVGHGRVGRGEAETTDDTLAAALKEVDALVATGAGRAAAARQVAARTGLPRRQLYRVERD
jgi:16S rRNA (cytidine1402-2'-O)-methyltransferase